MMMMMMMMMMKIMDILQVIRKHGGAASGACGSSYGCFSCFLSVQVLHFSSNKKLMWFDISAVALSFASSLNAVCDSSPDRAAWTLCDKGIAFICFGIEKLLHPVARGSPAQPSTLEVWSRQTIKLAWVSDAKLHCRIVFEGGDIFKTCQWHCDVPPFDRIAMHSWYSTIFGG